MRENYNNSERSDDYVAVISLAAHRAKKRRAAAAAKADARRGALITMLLVCAGMLCVYTLHKEQQLHQLERNVHHLRMPPPWSTVNSWSWCGEWQANQPQEPSHELRTAHQR